MKYTSKRLYAVLAALVAVAWTVAIPTHVQAQSTIMTVNVPFDFHVGDQKFPAGAYLVSTVSGFVRVSDRNRNNAFTMATPITRQPIKEKGHLVFNVYGEEYFLSEAQWGGYTTAYSFPKVSLETEITKNLSRRQLVTPGLNR